MSIAIIAGMNGKSENKLSPLVAIRTMAATGPMT
jgi:hypothetical protein